MTLVEHGWLIKLSNVLENHARTFENPRYRGFWNSVIDKYSDKAHFIYELLQNADDTGATEAEFDLSNTSHLSFSHNGIKHFTISNPDCEEQDQRLGRLGCLNAITSIGQSEKILEEKTGNQIGKFGIGFKSVFRYTNNPRIYDDNVCFQLKHRIVPYEICDLPDRRRGRTVFVLPFDKENQNVSSVIAEITASLLVAESPELFLNNIKDIKCKLVIKGRSMLLHRSKICDSFATIELPGHERIETCVAHLNWAMTGMADSRTDIRLFSRLNSDGRKYCVGYKIDNVGRPIPLDSMKAFCYFQTEVQTGLKFIIHAPFKLTDSREGIVNDEYNQDLIKKLSILAADSILAFKEIGTRQNVRLIDDSFVDLLPLGIPYALFKPFEDAFLTMISNEEILPSESGYVKLGDALWPSCKEIQSLFPPEKLSELIGQRREWVFVSCPSEVSSLRTTAVRRIMQNGFGAAKVLNTITAAFIETQSVEWLGRFYKFVMRYYQLQKTAATSPILLSSTGKAVSARKPNGEKNIFLPINTDCEFQFMKKELLEVDGGRAMCSWLGLTEPSKRDAIKRIVRELIPKSDDATEYYRLFKQVLDYYLSATWSDRQEILKVIQESRCLRVRRSHEKKFQLIAPSDKIIYFPLADLLTYFCGEENAFFVDEAGYEGCLSQDHSGEIKVFLEHIGVHDKLKYWVERGRPCINCCRCNLKKIGNLTGHCASQLSYAIWKLVGECLDAQRGSFVGSLSCGNAASETLKQLRETKWLIDAAGNLMAPGEMWIEDIPGAYSPNSPISQQMIELLQMRRNPENVAIETLSENKRHALDLGQQLINAGITTIDDIKDIVEAKQKKISISTPLVTPILDSVAIQLDDGQYAGLSNEQKSDALLEAKRMVQAKLAQEGFEFEQGLCEKEFSIINGVKKDGVEYPLVVHSYLNRNRQFQLSPADWDQLTKPYSMLWVRTQQGVGCVPFRELVLNREKIDLSFSTTNLEIQDRIGALASVMRWFKGLHFDFGSLIQPKVGQAVLFDLPEQGVSDEQKTAELLPDLAEGVLG